MSSFTFESEHGLTSVIDTALHNDKPALLLLHGNSSSSKIFRHITESQEITSRWRVVTFCLPGHGSSSKAPNPSQTYHMRGYAEVAVRILQHLNIEEVVVIGWSLGGHIGIEMIELLQDPKTRENNKKIVMKGLMLIGTPPALGVEQVRQGFTMATEGSELGLAGQRDWTNEQAVQFSKNSAAAGKEEFWARWMEQDARDTDPRARMIMADRFLGKEPGGVDQRKVAESTDVLIAVVNGAEEQFVNLDYLDKIKWKNLWKNECLRLDGLHHAPFWEDPARFEKILVEFVADVEMIQYHSHR
jgi:pimeloyl-ACP methyl ester carboxylesterase